MSETISTSNLAVATGTIVIDEADRYFVSVEPGEFLAVCFGQDARDKQAKFQHPNLARRNQVVHEFKHESNGRKWWTAKPGVDFWFIVPRRFVEIEHVKGYSYIHARINGVKVRFNVSGGTFPAGGWTDMLCTLAHVSVGHSMRDLKRVADIAVPPDHSAPFTILPRRWDERTKNRFAELIAASEVLARLRTGFKKGERPFIHAVAGSVVCGEEFAGGVLEELTFQRTTKWTTTATGRTGVTAETKRIKSLVVRWRGANVRVTPAEVDWLATAESLEGRHAS